MKKRRTLILATALVFVMALTSVVHAREESWTHDGITITFETPDTYHACLDETTFDTITATGLPEGWTLDGWVRVVYITGEGRQDVPGGFYDVHHVGPAGFSLEVSYPPVSEWPVFVDPNTGNCLVEIHVDLSIVVKDQDGASVEWVGDFPGNLGPGFDWDVFCLVPPPPPPPGPGTGTPGYWKNHPEAWPVEEITIGGVTYSKADAIKYMKKPVKKDKTLTMFPALVSAKLNVLIGNDDTCIAGTIAAADAWMADYGPVGSGVKASSDAWKMGEPLYEELDLYNNGELCAPHRD